MNRSDDENYHGLVAESYDLFRGNEPVETHDWYRFYKRWLEERPGLALEPACGTGRILLPFLRAGFSMEGLDSSPEMLAICQSKAVEMGLEPVLYRQYMQELDLPKRYTTILIPLGSFILIERHDEAQEALRRFHAHLLPGGQLIFSMPAPSSDFYAPKSEDPEQWGEASIVTRPSDCATILLRGKSHTDRLEQTHHGVERYELYDKTGKLIRTEEHTTTTRWYGKHEMRLMLQLAGFRNMKIYGNHTDAEATADSGSRVYWAER